MNNFISISKSNNDFIDYFSHQLTKDEISKAIIDFRNVGLIAFEKLELDFAIIFTTGNKTYFLRDPFGNIPLYYFIFEDKIFYSNNIKDLIENSVYKKSINTNELYNYFNISGNVYGYSEETLWKDIYSVIPGQLLEFDSLGKKIYKNFFKLLELSIPKCEIEIYKVFQEIFKQSILKNVNSNEVLTSTLSGGIDSSSITCMAAKINSSINTIELRTSFEIGLETKYAKEVVNKWNTNHTVLSNYPNFFISEKINAEKTGLPSYSLLTSARQLSIFQSMNTNKSNKIMLGEGGDQILGLQKEYLNELVLKEDFETLKTALKEALGCKNISKIELLKIPYAKSFIQGSLKGLIFNYRFFLTLKFLKEFYNVNLIYKLIREYLLKKIKTNSISNNSNLVNNLIKIKKQKRNIEIYNHLDLIKKDNEANFEYLKNIFSKESIKLKEQYFLLGQNYNTKFIYPFYNLKIMSFIAQSDKKLNFGNGIGRNILRQSMLGILPDSIINRKSKTYFSPFLHQVFWDLFEESQNKFDENHKLWEIFDFKLYSEIVRIVKNTNYFDPNEFGIKNTYLVTCIKIYYVGIWLDSYFE